MRKINIICLFNTCALLWFQIVITTVGGWGVGVDIGKRTLPKVFAFYQGYHKVYYNNVHKSIKLRQLLDSFDMNQHVAVATHK